MKKGILTVAMLIAVLGAKAQSTLPTTLGNDTVGFYRVDANFTPYELVLTKNIPDSIYMNFYKMGIAITFTDEVKAERKIQKNEMYNANLKSSAFYLQQAGKYKNAAVAITSLGGTTSTILLLEHPANAPSAAIISGISSIAGWVLNIAGNNALVKAGQAKNLDK